MKESMPTFVFDFYNIYIPSGKPYSNDKYNVTIEPLPVAEEFEDKRREPGSDFRTGYWKTAECCIMAETNERAEELAEWLTFIYSFTQNRDVIWTSYETYESGAKVNEKTITPYTYSMDNTNLRIVKSVYSGEPSDLRGIGELVDVALDTLDAANENSSTILRTLSLYMESEQNTYWMIKFLFLWIILESHANEHYNKYFKSQGDMLFSDSEQDRIQELVLEHFSDSFTDDQLQHLDWLLDRSDIYESSSRVKIIKYIESLKLGFEMDEIEGVVELARSIRNPIVHEIDTEKLMNNTDVVTDMRKIVIYVILRLLGVDRDMQQRLITPQIFGPDINLD